MTRDAIAFTGLGHAYRRDEWIFRGYHGRLAKGRIMAVLGPNGCGKTTLLRLLLGIAAPTEGQVTIEGKAAFVPQLFQVGFDYSVLDMVLMGRAAKVALLAQPSRRDEEAALAALDRVGMADFASRPFHHLSGGQRQMVIFARALVSAPEIMILDEPSSALDLRNQAVILERMAMLAHHDGLSVLFTTHHPHHALSVADDVLLMLRPDHAVSGPVADILTEDNLRQLYGVPLKLLGFEHEGRPHRTLAPVLTPEVILERGRS
ncbi:MAG: ABC transporter ATP-binding protein [Magnetospirillum sp.]